MPTEETDDKFHRTRPCGEKAGFTAVKERERGGIQPLVCAYIYFEHHSLNSKGKSCVDKSHSLILKEMLFPFAPWKTWTPQTAHLILLEKNIPSTQFIALKKVTILKQIQEIRGPQVKLTNLLEKQVSKRTQKLVSDQC